MISNAKFVLQKERGPATAQFPFRNHRFPIRQDVCLVHEVRGEQYDSSFFIVLQQRPHVTTRVRIYTSSGLVQDQYLQQIHEVDWISFESLSYLHLQKLLPFNTFGSPITAIPMESFLFCPPLNCFDFMLLFSSKFTSFSTWLITFSACSPSIPCGLSVQSKVKEMNKNYQQYLVCLFYKTGLFKRHMFGLSIVSFQDVTLFYKVTCCCYFWLPTIMFHQKPNK